MSVTEAMISFILCIITGCGFISMHINGIDAVKKEETISVTGTFESYDYYQHRGTFHYIILSFTDIENQTVDGSCYSEALFEEIDKLSKGTELHMLIDEENGIIMELKTDDRILLDFDVACQAVKSERTEFIILGIGMIIIGLSVFVYVIRSKNKKV